MWNWVTGSTLVVVALFTPFEVAFLDAPTHVTDPLFVLGRFIDVVFFVDMCLQFITMTPHPDGGADHWISDWRTLCRNYLLSWFMLDFFSVAAAAFDVIPLVVGTASGEKDPLAAIRVIRILRLSKLVRLVRASKRIKEWYVQVATPRAIPIPTTTPASSKGALFLLFPVSSRPRSSARLLRAHPRRARTRAPRPRRRPALPFEQARRLLSARSTEGVHSTGGLTRPSRRRRP